MLSLSKITKIYSTAGEEVTALREIDLHFRRHEFVSILGPSGCGKTTMLNIIGGLDHYTSGDLTVDGVSTREYTDRDWDTYRNHRIGFVFQNYQLIPHQTVLSNVELALTLSGVSKAERRERAIEALKKVGLGDQIRKKPNQMSGGQMQRVAIARALVNDPEILLADEPTGALDTQTSVQIMDLLREVASDRLVIMVTHNPELAGQYSTRIIRVLDGQLIGDSDPYTAEEAQAEVEAHLREKEAAEKAENGQKKEKRTSMSFWTALTLSCNNLLTKKTRTLLTSFAGSIGIIGIALILSLSNGIQIYIDRVQEDALSSYPLAIESVTMDMTDMLEVMVGTATSSESHEDGYVYTSPAIVKLISAFVHGIRTNDLKSFKEYIESGETDIADPSVATIEYEYGITPQIFHTYRDPDTGEETVIQANPSSLFSSVSLGAGMTLPIFDRILDNPELLDAQYDLLGGKWPSAYDELVLVVDSHNEINDVFLYALGLKDPFEFRDTVIKILSGTDPSEIDMGTDVLTYDDIMAETFTLIISGDLFEKDQETGLFVYKGEDQKFLRDRIAQADTAGSRTVTLRISGIVRPKKDAAATSITGVIGYTSALNDYLLAQGPKTDVAIAQLATPDTDVLTGLPFKTLYSQSALKEKDKADIMREEYDAEGKTVEELRAMYAELLMPYLFVGGIGEAALEYQKTFSLMPEDQVPKLRAGLLAAYLKDPALYENDYLTQYLDEMGSEGSFGFDSSSGTMFSDFISAEILMSFMSDEEINTLLLTVAGVMGIPDGAGGYAVKPLADRISDAEKAAALVADGDFSDFYKGELEKVSQSALALMWEGKYSETSKSSLAENSVLFGLGDENNPTAINIYPVSFEMKDHVTEEIEKYNQSKENEEEQIVYTDYIGVLFSSISLILNIITYVLVAFVAISLVVSSIMIGIITYISVLERTREIGILRAVGASKRDVSRVFNAETLIIGLVAGLMGILGTLILIIPINAIIRALAGVSNIGAELPWAGAVILVVISCCLTLIAGLIPSRVAAKKDPVEALRTE